MIPCQTLIPYPKQQSYLNLVKELHVSRLLSSFLMIVVFLHYITSTYQVILFPMPSSPQIQYAKTSLIPKPPYRQVFDHSQYAKSEGGGPGPLYHVNDVSVYLGRQRGEGSL